MHRPAKKGYLLGEMLVVVACLGMVSVLVFTEIPSLSLEHFTFVERYLMAQAEAIATRKEMYVGEGIHFNKQGNVNQGKTLLFPHHKVVIYLGNGGFHYE